MLELCLFIEVNEWSLYTGNAWAFPCLMLCLHFLSTLRRKLTHILCTSLKPQWWFLGQWYWKLCIQKVRVNVGPNEQTSFIFLRSAVGILRKALLNGWPLGCTKDVLEKLVPHTNLNKLQIHNYGGTRFQGWLGDDSICNIVSVSLQNGENFCILLPLGKLPSLKHFFIEGFDEVVAVGPEF